MSIATVKDVWKQAWNSPVDRPRLIVIIVLTPFFFILLPIFFNNIEKRNGVVLNDWVLAHIPAHNVSIIIFALIWGMILLTLYRSFYSPKIFITYCLTLALVIIARIICISLVPLAPPVGLIQLTDPLSGVFYGEAAITKDLFFSGHTATLVTIFFCLEKKTDRLIGMIAAIAVAILLLVQHIHYTVDVLTAFVAVYVLYGVTCKYFYKQEKQQVLPD